MVAHGAQNLIFANRSGLKSDEAKASVQSLRNRGCQVAVYSCDITDANSVSAMAAKAAKEMPCIKGAIQGAMLLRVSNSQIQSLRYCVN